MEFICCRCPGTAGGAERHSGVRLGLNRMDMVSSTPAPLETCTQERTKHLLPVTAEVKSVWNSPVVKEGVGGDLARSSSETSSHFSPVQQRTLELGNAGESQHCPHPCQVMEWGWIRFLTSSFTLLLPKCGGFKADESSLQKETGWHRPSPVAGGPYADNRAGEQNRKQKSVIFAQNGSVKKKGNQRSWSKRLPKQGDWVMEERHYYDSFRSIRLGT